MKYFLPIIFFFILCGSVKGQMNDDYLKGCASFEKGDFLSALTFFNQKISSSNNNIKAILKRGETYSITGDYNNAIKDLLQVAKADSGKASIYLARYYSMNNNVQESVKWLRIHLLSDFKTEKSNILTDKSFTNISDSPEWEKIWKEDWYSSLEEQLTEASYLIKQKEEYEALELLDNIVKQDKSGHAYFLRSMLNSDMGFDRKAISDLEKAIILDFYNYDFNNLMAELLIKKGKYDQALKYFNRILSNQPENFSIRMKRANLLIESGKYYPAKNDLDLLIEFFPDDVEMLVLFGNMLYKTGQNQESIQYFTRAIIQQPLNSSLYSGRAIIHHEMKNYSKAISDYSMALDIDPRNPETWFERGKSRYASGNSEAACSDWYKALIKGHREAINMIDKFCNK